jgi:hypothetical protein
MKVIKVSQGFHTLVDDDDYNNLNVFNWLPQKLSKTVYARKQEKGKFQYMHRIIMNAKKGEIVDHKNGDGLDNRKFNLRKCTRSENGCNRGKDKDNSSGYKGVQYITNKQKRVKRWVATITKNKRNICVGYFHTKEEAALAWNEAAKKYHGEFAKLNIIIKE